MPGQNCIRHLHSHPFYVDVFHSVCYSAVRVFVNACCPGWCVTDMTSGRGMKTADGGADTPTYLALLPTDKCVTGGFFSDRKQQEF